MFSTRQNKMFDEMNFRRDCYNRVICCLRSHQTMDTNTWSIHTGILFVHILSPNSFLYWHENWCMLLYVAMFDPGNSHV